MEEGIGGEGEEEGEDERDGEKKGCGKSVLSKEKKGAIFCRSSFPLDRGGDRVEKKGRRGVK